MRDHPDSWEAQADAGTTHHVARGMNLQVPEEHYSLGSIQISLGVGTPVGQVGVSIGGGGWQDLLGGQRCCSRRTERLGWPLCSECKTPTLVPIGTAAH